MALSGVAGAESRCGKNLIAQMLCGSKSAKLEKLRLNRLTTFGLLRQLKQTEVVTLIDLLIANGCIEQENVDRFRPVVETDGLGSRGDRGKAICRDLNLPPDLRTKLGRPVAKAAAKNAAPPASRDDRWQIVPEAGTVHDATDDSAQGTPPVDEYAYGPEYDDSVVDLPRLRHHTNRPHASRPRPAQRSGPPARQQILFWTWQLFSRGFSADECMAIRGIGREALLDHTFAKQRKRGWMLEGGIGVFPKLSQSGPYFQHPKPNRSPPQLPPGTVRALPKCLDRPRRTPPRKAAQHDVQLGNSSLGT